jgi:DNA-binding NtrC family response regulator
MLFHEFLAAHRQEILESCEAELAHPEGLYRLARYVCNFFDQIVQLLKPGTIGAEESLRAAFPPILSSPVLGRSLEMTRLRIALDRLSHRSRASLSIFGDAGTGRLHCARALHAATYPEGQFFELTSADDLSELAARVAMLRSQMSGLAAGGLTVYVRELCETPPIVQEKVAQLLGEQRLPLRVIVSSSQPLREAARERRLRSDLVLGFSNELKLPPLAERIGDLPELVEHFAQTASAQTGTGPIRFTNGALSQLRSYSWPGNLTELWAFVERLARQYPDTLLDEADLPELGERPSGFSFELPATGIDLAALERQLLTQALALAQNNQTRAASLLGLTRDQMRYRLAKFEIFGPAARSG